MLRVARTRDLAENGIEVSGCWDPRRNCSYRLVLLHNYDNARSVYALGSEQRETTRKRVQYVVTFLNKNGYFGRDWYLLGVSLQLMPGKLDVIKQNYGSDCEQCLIQCILCWLNQQDGIAKREGVLKWKHYKALSEALKRIHENAIAEKLEQQCEYMSCYSVLILSQCIIKCN